jgi:hypothetical protein
MSKATPDHLPKPAFTIGATVQLPFGSPARMTGTVRERYWNESTADWRYKVEERTGLTSWWSEQKLDHAPRPTPKEPT